MKRIYYFLFIIPLLFTMESCLNLDSMLYDNTTTDEYLLDNYDGYLQFRIPDEYKIPTEKINLITFVSDNNGNKATIYAIYVGDISKISTDTVILYCHGNANNMDYYWPRTKLLANVGGKNHYGVLIFDYRGYGKSEGIPSEDNLYADTKAALQWLKSNGLTNDRLVVYGYSMGTAPATEICANPDDYPLTPSWLILESPFASSDVMVQNASVLNLPHSFFTNLKIDNAEKIKYVSVPFMWLHGVNDDFLNMETNGEVVFKNYKGPYKEAHRIKGATHSDVPKVMGFQNYINAVYKFISQPH